MNITSAGNYDEAPDSHPSRPLLDSGDGERLDRALAEDTGTETQESGRLFRSVPEQEGPRPVALAETPQAVTYAQQELRNVWLCIACLVNAKTAMAAGAANGSVPNVNLAAVVVEGRTLCTDHIAVQSPLLAGVQMPNRG